jgi:hypothetical protein
MRHTVSVTPQLSLTELGHIYRSTYLEECARVEMWIERTLQEVNKRRGVKHRSRRLLNQKVEELNRYIDADLARAAGERLFKSPARVRTLLARLQPFTSIRSTLSHSTQAIAIGPSGVHLFVYTPACGSGSAAMHLTLTEQMQTSLLAQLRAVAKELGDQRLRPIKACAPPPPKTGAAAGP